MWPWVCHCTFPGQYRTYLNCLPDFSKELAEDILWKLFCNLKFAAKCMAKWSLALLKLAPPPKTEVISFSTNTEHFICLPLLTLLSFYPVLRALSMYLITSSRLLTVDSNLTFAEQVTPYYWLLLPRLQTTIRASVSFYCNWLCTCPSLSPCYDLLKEDSISTSAYIVEKPRGSSWLQFLFSLLTQRLLNIWAKQRLLQYSNYLQK